MSARPPIRIAALLSGGGRTLLNLLDAIDHGALPATVTCVISSRADAPGVARVRERGYDVHVADPAAFENDDATHDAIDAWLDAGQVDLVCLCGYLRWLRVAPARRGRVINIHPALLPDFGGPGMYGRHVHQAVLHAGRGESGCTVHLVDDVYDHGPTILQRRCPVLPDDDASALAARVFAEECLAYPQAIRLFAEDRVHIEGDTVRITTERIGADS